MKTIFHWLTQIPQRTYPFSPTGDTWRHLYFWWRQMWHFVGGLFCGGVALGMFRLMPCPFVPAVIAGIFFGVIYFMETQDHLTGQPKYKTVVDVVAWSSGFLLLLIFPL